jgi:glycosyltransferase involved in cell wall biosynthesis
MNIAEITTYKEGGAYTHVVELVKGFKKDKILIISGNTNKSGYQEENGYKFYHIPLALSVWDIFFINKLGSYKRTKNLLEKRDIDIVHFHSPLFTFLIGLMRKKKHPTIMTTHYLLEIKANSFSAALYRRFIKFMTKTIGRYVDKIICVNRDYIPIFEKWGINPDKLIYIPNGVDIKKFSPGISKIKKKFEKQKLIVYFGRLHYQKNVDLLIRSFKLLKNKMENIKLVIIGDGTDYHKLKKMSTDDKDIIMTGFVSDEDLVDYLRAANIIVFPSRGENASFTLMEAMACELPVVSSDVGNAKRILGNGRGFLLEKYTEEEIAGICEQVLNDEKNARKIGKKARDYVEENHSWEKISKNTQEVYKSLM